METEKKRDVSTSSLVSILQSLAGAQRGTQARIITYAGLTKPNTTKIIF